MSCKKNLILRHIFHEDALLLVYEYDVKLLVVGDAVILRLQMFTVLHHSCPMNSLIKIRVFCFASALSFTK